MSILYLVRDCLSALLSAPRTLVVCMTTVLLVSNLSSAVVAQYISGCPHQRSDNVKGWKRVTPNPIPVTYVFLVENGVQFSDSAKAQMRQAFAAWTSENQANCMFMPFAESTNNNANIHGAQVGRWAWDVYSVSGP